MKRISHLLALVVALSATFTASAAYSYDTVPGDPMKARIYTLPNGLKVYLSENHLTPRIQTYIAVRVGGKNDPAETTGLSHYLEHLMFKGTSKFGTMDYAKERPMLDEIERLYEVYRHTTDSLERKAIYHIIDSVSYEASKVAIPNEYDKLMSVIGATGTNAYTSYDQTVYVDNIPANQVENWARIQGERFSQLVVRGFHTELEAVYEEKNTSLTRDSRKVWEAMYRALFPDHPYGQQTVIGTQDHLKNPSITNIRRHFDYWYVPNNMAVCMAGDFDCDEVIAIIDRYLGTLTPNPELHYLPTTAVNPLHDISDTSVLGLDSESIYVGWRLPGAASPERDLFALTASILYNGKAGLIDLDINQPQKALGAYGFSSTMADYSMILVGGEPKEGQTLDEVKTLLLAEVEKLRRGDFDESLLQSAINNYKYSQTSALTSNESRADAFVDAFVDGIDWADEVNQIARMEHVTKADIVAFAQRNLGDNYAIVRKLQGKDPNEKRIEKPAITPIVMNRDSVSAFLAAITAADVKPIEPVFTDFDKEMSIAVTGHKLPMLYKHNDINDIYELTFLFETGSYADRRLPLALNYLNYLGTSGKTLAQINNRFYNLAAHWSISAGGDRSYVVLTGLKETLEPSLSLLEELVADAQVNREAYDNLVADILKERNDAKANQQQNFSRLLSYATYGDDSPAKNLLSEAELKALDPQELIDLLHGLYSLPHEVLYYGPLSQSEAIAAIDALHRTPASFRPLPEAKEFKPIVTDRDEVLFADYDANQVRIVATSNRGATYDATLQPQIDLYNEYFSGSMNSIVFQEMREARALAYHASSRYTTPSRLSPNHNYTFRMVINTQNDKMLDALTTFFGIVNVMPESEKSFQLAKEGLLNQMRSERIVGDAVLWHYIACRDRGLKQENRRYVFEQLQRLELPDVVRFQQEVIANRAYRIAVLGNPATLDIEGLKRFGTVTRLSQEDIFGY